MKLTKRQVKILKKFFRKYPVEDFYSEVEGLPEEIEYSEIDELYDLFDEESDDDEAGEQSFESFFEEDDDYS